MTQQPPCLVCSGTQTHELLSLESIPVTCNVLLDTPEAAARIARGTMELAWCETCGLLFNRSFDPDIVDYTAPYENALHGSATFRAYAEGLADHLVETGGLVGGSVLEVGCGDGYFLRLLRDRGVAHGVGVDPSYRGERTDDGITFVADYYDSAVTAGQFDLVCARHVLEHVIEPVALLEGVAARLTEDGTAYVEVPDGRWTLVDLSIWDVIYEHCSYFTPPALRRAALEAELGIRDLRSSYGGQFLGADLTRGHVTPSSDDEELHQIAASAHSFPGRARQLIRSWSDWLADRHRRGDKVALWGAGSKGVTLLNLADAEGACELVIDVNPLKHGRYVPGTGQEIAPADRLRGDEPWWIVITNPLYEDEIRQMATDLNPSAQVVCATRPPRP